MNLTEDQRDCLQEVINVAMGQASDKLARYLETFVLLQIPSIEQIDTRELSAVFSDTQDNLSVVSQGFYGNAGIRGEALLVYKLDDSHRLAELLGYEPDELSEEEQLVDISSILTTTFLNGFAAQIEDQMSYSAPRMLSSNQHTVSSHLDELATTLNTALKVNIAYQVTDYSFHCDMILLIPEPAIKQITTILDRILEEF